MCHVPTGIEIGIYFEVKRTAPKPHPPYEHRTVRSKNNADIWRRPLKIIPSLRDPDRVLVVIAQTGIPNVQQTSTRGFSMSIFNRLAAGCTKLEVRTLGTRRRLDGDALAGP